MEVVQLWFPLDIDQLQVRKGALAPASPDQLRIESY
jgi:hypothetical protein